MRNRKTGKWKSWAYMPVTSHAEPGSCRDADGQRDRRDEEHRFEVVPANFEVRVAEGLERRDLLALGC